MKNRSLRRAKERETKIIMEKGNQRKLKSLYEQKHERKTGRGRGHVAGHSKEEARSKDVDRNDKKKKRENRKRNVRTKENEEQ